MRARIRSIKPEVHMDEELWDLEQETGLPIFRGFVGLWNMSDKESRFEWRPRALKAAILPFWEGDFSRVLHALSTRGFIRMYTVDGRDYGHVRTFKKHQVINNRESESELPPPPWETSEPPTVPETPTRGARVGDASGTRQESAPVERKGTEGNGKEPSLSAGAGEASQPSEQEPAVRPVRAADALATPANQQTGVRSRGEQPPLPEPPEDLPDEPDAAQVQSRFRRLYEARFRMSPSMSGKSVHEFPDRLLATARMQRRDPLQLLEEAFGRWQPSQGDEQGRKIAKEYPYAAFCGRFGSLVDPTEHRQAPGPLAGLQDAKLKALRKGDAAECARLEAAIANIGNGGRSAR